MRNSEGMTLVEVMIALGIFSVGILATAALQQAGIDALTRARLGSDHSYRAAVHIESILSMDYDDPALADTDNGYHPQDPDHGPLPISSGGTLEWEVDDDFPVAGTKRIGVTVRGCGGARLGRPLTYEYVKARNLR